MARQNFGGSASDFVFGTYPFAGKQLIDLQAATLTFWSAETGGTQYTSLLLNGSPVTEIVVGVDGQIPSFQGPDSIGTMWASANGGARVLLAAPGNPGPVGPGVPAGGTTGQVLAKTSGTDYATGWVAQTGGGGGAVSSVAGRTGAVTLAKADVGLGSVDNTSDAGKPVSTAQQAALDAKATLQQVATTVTASGAAVANKHNPADATAAARTISLPTGQAEGTQISVEKTDASVNTVSITGNIRGVAASTISLSYQSESLMLRADSAGSWWPIAGHRTKSTLDAAYYAKASPSYAGTRTRTFDPILNIYGSATSRAAVRRALGFALGSAKSTIVPITIAGDSATSGWKANNIGTDDFVTLLTGALKEAGYPVTGGWVYPGNGQTPGDVRWTFGGTNTWQGKTTLNSYVWSTATGNSATFTSTSTGTILEFACVVTAAAQTVSYNLDGGAQVGTFNLTANVISTKQFTGLTSGTHTVTITTTGTATMWLCGARVRDTTGVSITNAGIFGAHTDEWLPTLTSSSIINPYNLTTNLGGVPKLVLLALGGNDAQHSGHTLAGFKTNLSTIVSAYQTAGAVVLQRIYNNITTAGVAGAVAGSPLATGTTWNQFLSAMYDVSDTYDTTLVDHTNVLGDVNTLEAAGLMHTDHLHLLTPGQAAVARADFRAIQGV